MIGDKLTLTVLPLDLGVDCELIPVPDGPTVLLIRPYPYQSFESAVDRVTRVLPYSPDEVRALLRPYFPTTRSDTGTAVSAVDAGKIRHRVHKQERNLRAMWAVVAGVVGLTIGWAVTTGIDTTNQTPTPVTAGPLATDGIQDALRAWDVSCSVSTSGWTAACQGPAVGGFTITAYTTGAGTLLSTRIGPDVLNMTILGPITHPSETAAVYNRIYAGYMNITGWAVALLSPAESGPSAVTGPIVMWGESEQVARLTLKAETLGYTASGGPLLNGPPEQVRNAPG